MALGAMRAVFIVGGMIIPFLALPLRGVTANEGEETEYVPPRAFHIAYNWKDVSSHTLSLALMEEGRPQWELRSHVLVHAQPPRTRWEEIRIQLTTLWRTFAFSCCMRLSVL